MSKKLLGLLTAVVFFAYLPASVSANGWPVDCNSLVVGGNIAVEDAEEILLEREDLTIVLSAENVSVTAKYTLKNTGTAKNLGYVFPINIYDAYEGLNWEMDYIYFYDGSKELQYTNITEAVAQQQANQDFNGYDFDYNYYGAEYYQSQLAFAQGETKVLTVSYGVKNGYFGWGVNNRLPYEYSDVKFAYNLMPAAHWGDGKAKEFSLYLDYSGLIYAENLWVNIPGFKIEDDGVFQYETTDFDFSAQEYITVVFNYPFERMLMYPLQLNAHEAVTSVYVPETYGGNAYKALFDDDWKTYEVFEFNKVPFIELEVEDWMFFWMLNGCFISQEEYYAYSRIKTLQIDYISERQDGSFYYYTEIIEFEDIDYSKFDSEFIFKDIQRISNTGFDKVQLTVLEVYPGEKYDSFCVSELYFFHADTLYDFQSKDIKITDISAFVDFKPSALTEGIEPKERTTGESVSRLNNFRRQERLESRKGRRFIWN